jgi:hypothetical protein
MQVKCDFCGSFIDEALETCPNCGAPNAHIKRAATGVPRTIEELKAFCAEKQIPLDKFKFHIGENYTGPQAFGIYYDEQNKEYVVYKNKTDGSRSVRYHGHDEGYAVNEIYQKLKEQIGDYKAYRASKGAIHGPAGEPSSANSAVDAKANKIKIITWAIIIAAVLIIVVSGIGKKSSGDNGSFYNYNGNSYYYNDGSWYSYDDSTGNYSETYDVPSELNDHRDDYYDDLNEYNRQTIDSDWDDDSDFDWSWSSNDDTSWDSGWDSGGSWDSDW